MAFRIARNPALVLALLSFPSVAGVAAENEKFELQRTTAAPTIDGSLDDVVWQGPPLASSHWLSYNPVNGNAIPQTTEVRAAFDDRYLYFSFHCIDPEPGKVRGTLSRRDNLFNDDWVGLSLDSVGSGQSSYDLFVNPLGVQGDILNSVSAGENVAPDFVWDSAGQRTDQGYDVEIRVPLTTIRFVGASEVKMGILFWRRVSRLGVSVSWPTVPAGASFLERQARVTVRDLKRPLTLEVIPSVTYGRHQTRTSAGGFGPADSDPDAGLSMKYGITSSSTIEGTLNPDFSQVESDAYQVDVNQRFPLFFSEKRPFFMEGLGTFEMAGVGEDSVMRTAVHTRRVVDPAWGTKATGTVGRVNFALLGAGDDAPGRPLEGVLNPFLGDRQEFFVARGQYSLGPSSYVGGLATDTEFGTGRNRVLGADGQIKRGAHRGSATFYSTATTSPDALEKKDGLGGQVFYEYATKPFVFFTQVEHFDPGFQMDTAFVNQVGVTMQQAYAAYRLYPDPEKNTWLRRVESFLYFRGGKDRIQGGDPWFVLPGIRFNLTRQGFFRVDSLFGEEPWMGQTFRISNTRVFAEAQITKWLYFNTRVGRGKAIFYDEKAPFGGKQRTYFAEVQLQPSARLNQTVSYDRVEFDRGSTGERVFTVNVLNTKTTFQLDRRFSVRAIVNYNSSASRVLTDLLASWELLPGTVVFVGYGSLIERQEWEGDVRRVGVGPYQTSQRGLFFKASYIHRF